jgi:alginate O-acetyltransferase complex protein AlgI
MLFNSPEFIVLFLPISLFVASRMRGQALLIWTTLVSFAFYAFAGELWFLIPMLITIVVDFSIAPWIECTTGLRKKLLLIISLCGNLGMLFLFKYSVWLSGGRWHFLTAFLLPAGISFYTFQTLSYIIDVYRGHAPAEKNFWKFTSFVSFFPHLVAGPLTRHHQLIPQLESISETGIRPRWKEGVYLFTLGLMKKVLIADRIAAFSDPIIGSPGAMTCITAWLSLLGYAMQIYFDFSGYTDMAIGLGRLWGIELPVNFNSPYKATDPVDFWRRWHITLSQWMRDYVYIPLGGNRCSPPRQLANLLLTMFLGGLWHGANWTFAGWGLYHGGLLIAYHLLKKYWDAWPTLLRRTLTFTLVLFGWSFFRATSLTHLLRWWQKLFDLTSLWGPQPLWRPATVILFMASVVSLGIVWRADTADSYAQRSWPPSAQVALGLGAVAAVLLMNFSSPFLYFQF